MKKNPNVWKEIPKFWKIYIITVTAIVLLCCVFLVFFNNYLKNYEAFKLEEAESRRITELLREKELQRAVRENSEREGGLALARRTALISEARGSSDAASAYVERTVESTPEKVIAATVASLNENGMSAVAEHIVCGIGKYEDPSSVVSYVDNLPGTYSCDRISEFEYSVRKGFFEAKVVLSEGRISEQGVKTYGIKSVTFSVPLKSYTAEAPEGARLTVNGKEVDEDPRIEKPDLSDKVPSSFSLSSVSYYEFDGFIYKPEIKAYLNGTECPATEGTDKTAFSDPLGAKYKSELYARICELTFSYSDYVAGAIKFEDVKQSLYPGTKFRDNLAHFDTRWYYDFDHIVNEGAKITRLTVLSENLVSARIVFNQSLRNKKDRETMSVPIELEVYVGCNKVPAGKDKSAWLLVYAGS